MTVCEKSDPVTLRNLGFWEDFTLACKTLLLLVSLSGITKKKNSWLNIFLAFFRSKARSLFYKKGLSICYLRIYLTKLQILNRNTVKQAK